MIIHKTLINLIKITENACGIGLEDIISKSRNNEVLVPRYILSKILRENYSLTFVAIGNILKKNHSTIIHYINEFDNFITCNEIYYSMYLEVKTLICKIKNQSTFNFFNLQLNFKEDEIILFLEKKGYSCTTEIEEVERSYPNGNSEYYKVSKSVAVGNDLDVKKDIRLIFEQEIKNQLLKL